MNNQPAFPVAYGGGRIEGMTLRDYFAAKAMQGFLANFDDEVSLDQLQGFATVCYALADAMLKAREE